MLITRVTACFLPFLAPAARRHRHYERKPDDVKFMFFVKFPEARRFSSFLDNFWLVRLFGRLVPNSVSHHYHLYDVFISLTAQKSRH